jgi:hypothetical protein
MKDLTGMSPVAKANYLERENAVLEATIARAAQQIFKLRQEVTGSLQILWSLAHANGGSITLPAIDLITAMGAVQRKHDVETDTYTFTALDPTPEQSAKFEAMMKAKPVLAVQDEQGQIVLPSQTPTDES